MATGFSDKAVSVAEEQARPLKRIPRYRAEISEKHPKIGSSSESDGQDVIGDVRGPINEIFDSLQIEKQKNPLVKDSKLSDAFIFAMKETTGRRCMKAAEDELVLDNFLLKRYFDEFEVEIPYHLLCDKSFVQSLEKMGTEMQFTFYIPSEDAPDKCSEEAEESSIADIDYNKYALVQFFCLKTADSEKMKRGIERSTGQGFFASVKRRVFSVQEKLKRHAKTPNFVEIWANENDSIVNSFLRNIKQGSDPYNYEFEVNPAQKEADVKDLSTFSTAYRKVRKTVEEYAKTDHGLRYFGPQGDPDMSVKEDAEFSKIDPFSDLNSTALITLSVISMGKIDALYKERSKQVKGIVGDKGWGSLWNEIIYSAANKYVDVGRTAILGSHADIAIEVAKKILTSLFSDVLRIMYQKGMEIYLFSGKGLFRTDKGSLDKNKTLIQVLEENGVSRPKSVTSIKFDPETLVRHCEDYPSVAFVRGTAQPTKDIGVLREWGSNATVASGGDKTFYLLQVFSIFKWLQTASVPITDIVGHSRGAGLAYNAAMLFNHFAGETDTKIKFCGLDGAITLPVALKVQGGSMIKPDSLFSRNINMASILDGALLDPNGYQERIIPKCPKKDTSQTKDTVKEILDAFDFSDVQSLANVFSVFSEQKDQGIGHDAGTAGTGYRKKLEQKIIAENKPWITVATGFKSKDEIRDGEWPKESVSNFGKFKSENDEERYVDLGWYWSEEKKRWHFRKMLVKSQPTRTFY